MKKRTYDEKCYELAALFLGDEPSLHTHEKIDELAANIQQAIEDFIEYERDYRAPNWQDAGSAPVDGTVVWGAWPGFNAEVRLHVGKMEYRTDWPWPLTARCCCWMNPPPA